MLSVSVTLETVQVMNMYLPPNQMSLSVRNG